MFSETVQFILANPAHIGPLEGATHCGVAGVPGDGPYMQLWLECREQGKREQERGKSGERDAPAADEAVIVRAAFKTFGCPSATAAGSMMSALLTGMPVEKARLLTAADLLLVLGGLPEGREFCATLAIDSLTDALNKEKHNERQCTVSMV